MTLSFTDKECFGCRGLTPLIEMAKDRDYRGPKIILCAKHVKEQFDLIDDALEPKPFKWQFWR